MSLPSCFLPAWTSKLFWYCGTGEAIVAQARAEAGIPRLLSIPHTLEKAVNGQIYAFEDVLQDLRVYLGQFRAYLFTVGQFGALVRVAKRDARHAVGIPAL